MITQYIEQFGSIEIVVRP